MGHLVRGDQHSHDHNDLPKRNKELAKAFDRSKLCRNYYYYYYYHYKHSFEFESALFFCYC